MKEIDINIEGYNVNGICVGCLNYNRKMFYHEDIKECFWTLADIDIPDGLSIQLCWECLASVRRAWQFRSQLLKSYDILNCYSKKHMFLNSPSDLTQYSTTRLSLSKVEINEDINFQPVLLKEDINDDKDQVKLELRDELVDFETLKTEDQIYDHDEDHQPEDFSQEPEPSSEDDVQLSKLRQRKERKKVKKRGKSDEGEMPVEAGSLHHMISEKGSTSTELGVCAREISFSERVKECRKRLRENLEKCGNEGVQRKQREYTHARDSRVTDYIQSERRRKRMREFRKRLRENPEKHEEAKRKQREYMRSYRQAAKNIPEQEKTTIEEVK